MCVGNVFLAPESASGLLGPQMSSREKWVGEPSPPTALGGHLTLEETAVNTISQPFFVWGASCPKDVIKCQ